MIVPLSWLTAATGQARARDSETVWGQRIRITWPFTFFTPAAPVLRVNEELGGRVFGRGRLRSAMPRTCRQPIRPSAVAVVVERCTRWNDDGPTLIASADVASVELPPTACRVPMCSCSWRTACG